MPLHVRPWLKIREVLVLVERRLSGREGGVGKVYEVTFYRCNARRDGVKSDPNGSRRYFPNGFCVYFARNLSELRLKRVNL